MTDAATKAAAVTVATLVRELPLIPPFESYSALFHPEQPFKYFNYTVVEVKVSCCVHPTYGGRVTVYYSPRRAEDIPDGIKPVYLPMVESDEEMDDNFISRLNDLLRERDVPLRLATDKAAAAREAFFAQPPRDPNVPLTPLQKRMQSGSF